MHRRFLVSAFVVVVAGCYDKPGAPGQDTETVDDSTAGDATNAGTDTTPSTSASGTMTVSSTDPSETDPTTAPTVSSTDPSETDPSSGSSADDTTTAPAACADGTADPGELCLDGVVPVVLAVGAGAFDLALADFDDSGALDIATVGSAATVSVLLADGAGGFGSPDSYTVADSPCRIHAVDGDADNDPDLVVGAESLVTLINDGAASFTRNDSAGSDLGLGSCGDLTVLNDNGGPLDVAYTGAYSFSYAPGVNPGTGWAFGTTSGLPGPGEGAWSVFATEFAFDADNDPDLLLINQYYSAVDIVQGDGFGNFDAFGSYDACTGGGSGSRAAAVGDIDGDGQEDIVTTCMQGNFTVATGNGDGTFAASPEFLFAGAGNPTLADLDLDDDLDLVLPSDTLGRINVYRNDDGALVDDPIQLDVGAPCEYAAVGDLNGDGALDIATAYADATGHVGIFLANP
jgi:FG-GAP-like repeat